MTWILPLIKPWAAAQAGGSTGVQNAFLCKTADNYMRKMEKKMIWISYSLFFFMLRFFYKFIWKKKGVFPSNLPFWGCSIWKIYRRKLHHRMHRVLEMLFCARNILEGSFKCPTWCNKNTTTVCPKLCIPHLTKDTATDKYQNRFVNAALLAAKNRSLQTGRLSNCQLVINGWLSLRIYCQWGGKGELCEQK